MKSEKVAENFLKLVSIMDELRAKCPWDQKQTIQSLRSMTIEETYELADAIDAQDWEGIKEELGDLLLHLLFYSKLAEEKKQFSIEEVLETIAQKMIRRHPHIYGDVQVQDAEEVKRNWQKIKLQEGKKSIFSGVPRALPSVVKAIRIQEKAKQVGFDWSNKEDVYKKVEEEIEELQSAIKQQDEQNIEEELGDAMFSLINYARFLKVDAETALEKCNKKFITRFQLMEELAALEHQPLSELSLTEMDKYWDKAKKVLKNKSQSEA